MKKLILNVFLSGIILFGNEIPAQTILHSGDIAIVQVNKSFQSFDFVPLVDIQAGTQIVFTDYVWRNSTHRFDTSTQYDGFTTFTAPTDISKGTVIQSKSNLNFSNSSFNIAYAQTNGYFMKGENIVAFQVNANDTTFLTAFGWMRQNNFEPNPSNNLAKVCDIPPGLSKEENTVIQMDSIYKPGTNSVLATNFRYNKYDGFEGTSGHIRYFLSVTGNYNDWIGDSNNDKVPDFTVSNPDVTAPELVYSYPSDNKANTSVFRSGQFNFNEPVIIRKGLTLKDNASNEIVKTYSTDELNNIQDSIVLFNMYQVVEKAKTYKLMIPAGFVTDLDNNAWPVTEQTFTFATNANRSVIDLNFGEDKRVDDLIFYLTRENIQWTTTDRFVEYEQNYFKGYFSWEMFGIPMRWYTDRIYVGSNSQTPIMGEVASRIALKIGLSPSDRLVIDLSGVNNTITDVHSDVFEDNCYINQKIYSGSQNVYTENVTGTNYVKKRISYENTNNVKIDSLVYSSLEGAVSRIQIEIVDQQAPTVELGNTRTICDGDSVLLDAGLTLGALYIWNNDSTRQKLWVKTSGNYSVTVKNSLGEASDNVDVIVKPAIVLSQHPDTIFACVGDTVTLTPVQNSEFSYLWSPGGETSSIIKTTKGGTYKVLISNGSCLKVDSIVVQYHGASLRTFFNQGGMTGFNDVQGELYRKEFTGHLFVYKLFRSENMPQFVQFDSLPKGEYLFRAHFVDWTFAGVNPFMDTYHDGKTTWSSVTPFHLTCESDTMMFFSLANKPSGFEFNGTAVIAGKVVIPAPFEVRAYRVKSEVPDVNGDVLILLYDGSENLIATTNPDSNGNYSFTNLPAGSYSVRVEITGYTENDAFTTNLEDGGTISNADFTVDFENVSVIQGAQTKILDLLNDNMDISIYPNPITNGILNFKTSFCLVQNVEVFDFVGKKVYSEKTTSNHINIQYLEPGFYLLKINSGGINATTKFIIK